jgi:microcystin-dependent protein
MADSFSTLLNLRLQQTGGNDNTWGDLLNSDVITPLENAIAGRDDHAVTGGTLDLSASPLVGQVQKFAGVLSSDLTVIIPNLSKRMLVYNNTSGAFAMLVKTAPGSAVAIPQGTFKDVYCDGFNNVFRGDRADVGEIKYFGGTTAPAGFFECDGTAVKRAKAPDLYAAIGLTWGPGNGSDDFPLPDFKTAGRFLRSRSGSVAAGTLQVDTVGPHNHPGSGSVSSSVSLSIAADGAWLPSISISDPTHNHQQQNAQSKSRPFGPTAGNLWTNPNVNTLTSNDPTGITAFSTSAPNHTHAGSTGSFSSSVTVTVSNNTGTTETRPINASALACIRY